MSYDLLLIQSDVLATRPTLDALNHADQEAFPAEWTRRGSEVLEQRDGLEARVVHLNLPASCRADTGGSVRPIRRLAQ